MNARHVPTFICHDTRKPLPTDRQHNGRIYDMQPDNFDLLRADLGPFWLAWIAAYTVVCIAGGIALVSIAQSVARWLA